MMNDCINDYKIMDLAGEGAFGKVYRAIGVDRKEYALKMIPISPKVKDKIREQGRLLASMQHPNILWAREFFYYQQERYFVIITEFCNHGGLDNHIGALDPAKTLSIMKGIAEGLLYLHQEKQIVHRDLKPENILLNNWEPKIADMGLAKMLKTYQVSTKIGTPTYMAFEMLEGDYSIEVDIWALGIIYIEMLLGKRIYELIKGEEIPAKRATFPSQDLLNQIGDEKIRKMVREMLKKNPRERIGISEVLAYFDITQLRMSKNRMTFNEQKKRKDGYSELVSDCYLKTEEYWFNKYPFSFIKQLYEKNMVEIVTQAEANNKKATFLLAKMYEHGIGMIKNAQKSQQLLLKCYEQQQPHCCYELYSICTSNTEKFQYLMSGKQLEEVRCLSRLAECNLEGLDGLSVDYQQAEIIIDDLCQKEYPTGYFLKGTLHSKKNTEYFNAGLMSQAFKKGSDHGHVGCKMGYLNDLYKSKKYTQALQFCKGLNGQASLELKDRVSINEIQAKCYGKLKNTEKTVEYYYKCLQLDNNSLQKDYMGSIAAYLESIKEYQKAMEFYNEAIDRLLPKYGKSEYCTERLRSLCETLYALYYQHKKYKEAYKIADLSAKLNFDNGKADQAYMIYGGAGVDKNETMGLNLLKMLAKEGNTEAQSYLNDIAHSKK